MKYIMSKIRIEKLKFRILKNEDFSYLQIAFSVTKSKNRLLILSKQIKFYKI